MLHFINLLQNIPVFTMNAAEDKKSGSHRRKVVLQGITSAKAGCDDVLRHGSYVHRHRKEEKRHSEQST